MILLWDGKQIQAVDLDKVIPGPRAEEVAALLEPGYLRGYLEGRGHDVAIREIKKKGRLGREYRQIQKLLRKQPTTPPQGAPWQYAMFLKERILEQAAPASTEQPPHPTVEIAALVVDDAQQPEEQPTMSVEGQTETSTVYEVQQPEALPTTPLGEQTETTATAVDEVQKPEAEQTTASAVDEAPPDTQQPLVDEVPPDVVETAKEAAEPSDGGGGKKRRKRRRKKRRKNSASANQTGHSDTSQ